MRRFARCCSLFLLLLAVAFIWPAYHSYTSVGIDLQRRLDPPLVRYTYLRLRFPGDGTLLVGYEQAHLPSEKPSRRVPGIGGRFFLARQPLLPRTTANRFHFYWLNAPLVRNALAGYWIGVPYLLVVLLSACMVLLLWNRKGSAGERTNSCQTAGAPSA